MSDTPGRRPTLSDAMILVAATALGIAASRQYLHWPLAIGALRGSASGLAHRVYLVRTWGTVLTPCLLSWALVIPLLGRRPTEAQPAPRRNGTVIAAVTTLVLTVTASNALLNELRSSSWHSHTFWDNWSFHALANFSEWNGLGIAAGWLGSALAGRGRPRPEWSTWMARLVGACWIVLSILALWLEPLVEL